VTGPLGSLLAAAVMLLCAVATGGSVVTLLRLRAEATERTLLALALGIGVQGTLMLGLAAIGWLHPAALWAAVVLPALPGIRELRSLADAAASIRGRMGTLTSVERITAALVTVVIAGILLVGALAPVMDWDSLMYHVQLPKLFLERGAMYLPGDGTHLAFLGLFQFLYLPLLAVGATAGPALLNAAMAGAVGLAMGVVGARLFSQRTALLGAIAIWGSSSLLLVGSTPRVDVALVFVLFLTHYAVLRALEDDARGGMVLVALLAGIAIAMKYHALPYLAPLVPFAVWGVWRRHGTRDDMGARIGATGADVALALAIALAVAAPWMLKNQAYFGAPLYPFFAERLVPPFIAEITGVATHPDGVPTNIYSALGQAREPISLTALLLRPAQLTVEAEGGAFTRNPLLYFLPLALLFLRDRRMLLLLVPGLAYLAVALGYFSRTNLRYLMPVLPAMVLCTVEAIRRVLERLDRPALARQLLLGLAALAMVPAVAVGARRLVTPVRAQVALGILPPAALLNNDLQYALATYVNEETPPDATVLMLFDARGYYHTRTVLQDNILTNWPLLAGIGAADRCLAGTGITHVVVNEAVANYYTTRGLDLTLLAWDRFPAFASRCLEVMIRTNGVAVYRVR
jgi:4-amino-4-deoxy-L-arabinose transferase-like glycosyltransferase